MAKDLRSQVDNARVKCIDIDRVQRTSMGYISNEINPQFCFLHYWLSSKILQATIIVFAQSELLVQMQTLSLPGKAKMVMCSKGWLFSTLQTLTPLARWEHNTFVIREEAHQPHNALLGYHETL